MTQKFEEGLGRREANYVPLTPIDFIARAAEVYGERLAVVHGEIRRTWSETYARARRLASALARANAAGALAVSRIGPMEGNSMPADIDRFLAERGARCAA